MNQTAGEHNIPHSDENEIHLKELWGIVLKYKWSIFLIIFILLLATAYILYKKTPVYISSAIIEVKSDKQSGINPGDFIGSNFSNISTEKVAKEIEILNTFHITDPALNHVNYYIRYFKKHNFKTIELYDDSPIELKNLSILDQDISGKKIIFTPLKNGYHLQVKNALKKKILHLVFDKKMVKLEQGKIYSYGSTIKTDYFEFMIEKKSTITEPMYFVINGSNRGIYESLNKKLNIFQINPTAPLIQISYQDTIPQRANNYVNALMESFISQSVAEKAKQVDRIIDFINNQLTEMKIKLNHSETELERYRIEYQAIDPTLQAQTYITELSTIEIELSQNRLKDVLIVNLLKYTKNKNDLDAIAPYLIELNDQQTLSLISRLQELEIEQEGLRTQFSAKHPGLQAVMKQIRHTKKKIILNIQNIKSSTKHRNKNLLKLKETYEKKLKSLPTQERTLINLKRDYEVSSQTYNYLLKKKSENEMIKVGILSDYNIVEPASITPKDPKNLLTILATFLLGLILGILQAFIRNNMDDKIHSKQDIEKLSTLAIFGILPKLQQKKIKLEVFKSSKSPFTESYRSLRTNIQFMAQKKRGNVILVTSSIMGEGKSTTAANLGAILNIADYKTIVINLDLRKPTLHRFFDIPNDLGMSAYLSGKTQLEEIITPTTHSGLHVIPSGPIPPNPSELILSTKLEGLIHHLKEHYDYIIIDSAPLALVTDTMHLMQHADISLVVVRQNYTIKPLITDLNKLVQSHDLKHVGIVMNDVDMSLGSYGYGYGYGYGYD